MKRYSLKITFILIFFISIHIINVLGKEKKDIELFPTKIKFLKVGETYVDPEGGNRILVTEIKESSYIKDNSGIDYGIKNVLGGGWDSAWCVNGNGIEEWVKVEIPKNQWSRKGITNVYRILIVNGLGVNKELYNANNRVKRIEVEFDDWRKVFLNLHDGDLELQRFKINIKAKWLKMTIKEIYKGEKYNDTCIGKIFFETD